MSRWKAFTIASCLGLLAVAVSRDVKADQWDKKTILTVNEPIAVPGMVLQPGKYVMRLLDSQSNRHIVQIYNGDETQLQTTVLAIPNYRLTPTGDSSFGFWETPAGQSKALRSWFYPGDNFGQEFAYPKDVAAQLAKANNQNVPTVMSQSGSDVTTAQVGEMTPQGGTTEMAQNKMPEQDQTAASESNTTSQSSSTVSTQSQTAASNEQNPPATEKQSATNSSQTTSTDQNAANTQNQTPSTTPSTESTTPSTSSSSTATSSNASNSGSLPSTASPFPLFGLGGLVSAGAALAARALSKRS
jgi:hypothetical protein